MELIVSFSFWGLYIRWIIGEGRFFHELTSNRLVRKRWYSRSRGSGRLGKSSACSTEHVSPLLHYIHVSHLCDKQVRWYEHKHGTPPSPVTRYEIPVQDLEETLKYQGTTLRTGDIMLVRSGYVRWHK